MKERIIVVPLRKARRGTSRKFASKAVRYLRSFISRHMKTEEVVIEKELNDYIWRNGITNPPRRVEVKAIVKEGITHVDLSSAKIKLIKKEAENKKKKPVAKAEKKTETKKKSVKKIKKKTVKTAKKKPAAKQKKKETVKKPVAKKKKVTKKPVTKKPVKKKATKAKKPTVKKTVKKTATKKTVKKSPAKK